MRNTIKSFIHANNKWSLKIVAAAILVPSTTLFVKQFDSDFETITQNEASSSPSSSSDHRNNKDRKKSSTATNNSDVQQTFDIGKDWINELTTNTPLKFLNEFIYSTDDDVDHVEDQNKDDDQDEIKRESNINLLTQLFFTNIDNNDDDDAKSKKSNDHHGHNDNQEDSNPFLTMAKSFTDILSGEASENALRQIVNHARNRTQAGIDGEESRSLHEVIEIFMTDLEKVKQSLDRNFQVLDDLGMFVFDPTSIFYYIESEDEKKNPSWKRRVHRFCSGIDLNEVNHLNDSLKLASLSYADTMNEIKEGLEKKGDDKDHSSEEASYELIYCQMESYPGKPSHYLAVKRGQSIWSNSLEMLLVIRGTKTVPDMLTDALLDATDYKGGKAHAGIMSSGKYLIERHSNMMESLLKLSNKKQIKLSIVGHSLGAGAATIAGMELKDNPKYDVSVVGFGCPALLSKELSESTSSFVTTVIGDSDIVPRMSAATIGNVVLNILEYDWTSKARRDVQQALHEIILQKTSFLFSDETVHSIMNTIDEQITNVVKVRIKEPTDQRMNPILYPPGKCIHFYRDGVAVSGALTPATFFNEIDISRTMIDDHYISGYRRLFLDVMRNYHSDDHFSFDQNDTA